MLVVQIKHYAKSKGKGNTAIGMGAEAKQLKKHVDVMTTEELYTHCKKKREKMFVYT